MHFPRVAMAPTSRLRCVRTRKLAECKAGHQEQENDLDVAHDVHRDTREGFDCEKQDDVVHQGEHRTEKQDAHGRTHVLLRVLGYQAAQQNSALREKRTRVGIGESRSCWRDAREGA